MLKEISSAVDFVSGILRKSECMTKEQLEMFSKALSSLLIARYDGHWYEEHPLRGCGYRCMRNNSQLNPILVQAGDACGVSERDLKKSLPSELTIWVDPREVTFRIGDEGSIGILHQEIVSKNSSVQHSKPMCRGEEFGHGNFGGTVSRMPAIALS